MLDTGLATVAYAAAWNDESTMYVELDLLFAEHARLLRRGGRYVTITGCYDDACGRASREVSLINAHCICDIHPRSKYFRAMARNRLVPVHVQDLTADTVPYRELRRQAGHLVTGIEETFLDAYRNGSFQYLLIVADRVRGEGRDRPGRLGCRGPRAGPGHPLADRVQGGGRRGCRGRVYAASAVSRCLPSR